MEMVIDGKLYNNDKAKMIWKDDRVEYYRTPKGNYFRITNLGREEENWKAISEEEARIQIGNLGVEAFKKAFEDVGIEEA